MAAPKPYDYELLDTYLQFDETSPTLLRWKVTPHPHKPELSGQPCGNLDARGYWRLQLKGRTYKLHRVIFVLHWGHDPAPLFVDHIDRNTDNNHPSNLRAVTYKQNNNNRKRQLREFAYQYTTNKNRWRGQYVGTTGRHVHVCTTSTKFEAQCLAMAHYLENHWIR